MQYKFKQNTTKVISWHFLLCIEGLNFTGCHDLPCMLITHFKLNTKHGYIVGSTSASQGNPWVRMLVQALLHASSMFSIHQVPPTFLKKYKTSKWSKALNCLCTCALRLYSEQSRVAPASRLKSAGIVSSSPTTHFLQPASHTLDIVQSRIEF